MPGSKSTVRPFSEPLDISDLPEPDYELPSSYTVRITGVGGSGVVTLSQIISAAATLVGKHVRTLDQPGLAQKGGAVVSDVKFTLDPSDQGSKASNAECDLHLGCDLLVAADARYLTATDVSRTTAGVSTSEVPTGQMVIDASVDFPDVATVSERISREVAQHRLVDARDLAVRLLGDDQFANFLLTGVAYEIGALSVSSEFIEEAIALNEVKVESNLRAFRYGRLFIADPLCFDNTLRSAAGTSR